MKCDDCDGVGWINERGIAEFHFDSYIFDSDGIVWTSELVGYNDERPLGRVNNTDSAILCPSCSGFGVEYKEEHPKICPDDCYIHGSTW